MRSSKLAISLTVLLASCGGSDDDPLPPAARDGLDLDLRVTVMPEGPGGVERVRRIECRTLGEGAVDPQCRTLGGLERQDLDPVPRRRACTQIYGGPATARVSGELRGARVTASFDLADGCEIDRWQRNASVLGPPPGRSGTP